MGEQYIYGMTQAEFIRMLVWHFGGLSEPERLALLAEYFRYRRDSFGSESTPTGNHIAGPEARAQK